ncbi:MAG: UDP-N-acetylmuramate dehydrogenase [Anaerolineales bacterium]|nr:UDP-N-acetylmuramate dehydrogenase [Anaerolineales bacterium]MCB9127951.1 UDP-N-acetylmuramate dehydrogenase [Ardenticatenales bacterium]MCB9171713.1 UDP-N-acetylmuramate dehydrogenase [Ardenticatenales bacterium]
MRRLQEAFGPQLQANAPLSRYTSFRVGGPADWLLRVNRIDELLHAVALARELAMPCRVLGGGSNVLVSDAGVRGLLILNRARQSRIEQDGAARTLIAESGLSLPRLAGELAKAGLSGMEWGIGVPGTVGGAVVQNAGAWGVETKDRLLWADLLNRETHEVERWALGDLDLRYRHSRLLDAAPETRPIVLRAAFRLWPEAPEIVSERTMGYRDQRTASQPRAASGGSTFRNPPGDYAGRLIEAAGLKGHRIGGAEFSRKHANFIVHDGTATAADIRALIDLAQREVAAQFGVRLMTEIEMVGDWSPVVEGQETG